MTPETEDTLEDVRRQRIGMMKKAEDFKAAQTAAIVAAHNEGASLREIAPRAGISHMMVRKILRSAGALALAAVLIACGAALGIARTSQASPAPITWNIGTARPSTTGGPWSFVSGGGHAPQGFGTPTCNASTGVLTVPYLVPLTAVVGSAVTTDEDWSREGIIVGASVGLDHADLYFTKIGDIGPIVQSCATIDAIGNVWVQIEGS